MFKRLSVRSLRSKTGSKVRLILVVWSLPSLALSLINAFNRGRDVSVTSIEADPEVTRAVCVVPMMIAEGVRRVVLFDYGLELLELEVLKLSSL